MNRVTLRASDVVQRMGRSANVGARQGVGMTFQASVQRLFRRELRKSNDGRFAAMSLDVGSARPMAAFTAGVFWFLCTTRDAGEVGVFVKPGPHIRMTCLAYRAAEITVLHLLLSKRRCTQESQKSKRSRNGRLRDTANTMASHSSTEMNASVPCFRRGK